MANAFDTVFEKARAAGRKTFVPYLTAGDPSLEATEVYVRALARAGADAIELGVPFSDPIADGPVNQRAAERALASGTRLSLILDRVEKLRAEGVTVPIVIFTYLNPILRMGTEAFAKRAAQVGVQAVLTVDLPPEEAESHHRILEAQGIGCIFLVSPTTDVARLGKIDQMTSGFVYYVSKTGVTGATDDRAGELSPTLSAELAAVRARVKKPVLVGFGISGPEQARMLAGVSDGVIVGSALVRIIEKFGEKCGQKTGEKSKNVAEAESELEKLACSIVGALKEKN